MEDQKVFSLKALMSLRKFFQGTNVKKTQHELEMANAVTFKGPFEVFLLLFSQ